MSKSNALLRRNPGVNSRQRIVNKGILAVNQPSTVLYLWVFQRFTAIFAIFKLIKTIISAVYPLFLLQRLLHLTSSSFHFL